MSAPLLAVRGLRKAFGGHVVLAGVDLAFAPQRLSALIGPNGAGKTTCFNLLTGLLAPDAGQIVFKGVEITGFSPDRRARLGICRSFQILNVFDGADITRRPIHQIAQRGIAWVPDNRRIFPTLTVERNLAMALNRSLPRTAEGEGWTLGRVYQRFPILGRLKQPSGEHLSGGEARLVAIARALLMHPRLGLLDEPSQGLAPRIVEDIMAVIEEIRDEGIAILLVEQNSTMALSIAHRAYVIDDGRIVHSARAADLEADQALKHRLLAV